MQKEVLRLRDAVDVRTVTRQGVSRSHGDLMDPCGSRSPGLPCPNTLTSLERALQGGSKVAASPCNFMTFADCIPKTQWRGQ